METGGTDCPGEIETNEGTNMIVSFGMSAS